ncbi:MAG: substrate-binding domain-containing protein [bacterium]
MVAQIALVSKYEQMVAILKAALERGEYPEGSRIPSENELAETYAISRNTVREAISSLVHQRCLRRIQGKGTFVLRWRPPSGSPDAYAIFMQAHSHVYEAETRHLVRAFQQAGGLPMVFDVADIKQDERAREILAKLLGQGVAGLIIEERYAPLIADLCRKHNRKIPPLAVLNYGSAAPVCPACCVYSDFEYGTRMGTQHLIAQGCRRVLFVIHRHKYAASVASLELVKGMYGDAVRGYKQAMAEAGLAEAFFFVDSEFSMESQDRVRLKEVLTGPERPDAIFAFGDIRAKHAIDIAADAGLKVPQDLSVIGYWNTPWAEMTRVPLTSISICEDQIANLAVQKLVDARKTGIKETETTIIKPRLVERSSCVSKNPKA